MKNLICILSISIFCTIDCYSQKLGDIGAGAIDFLLRNPKTANRMKPEESIALDIISDLLKTESERKHQLEYATAGRNQITINTNDGRNAQFVKNEKGEVFLLLNGTIYPIAQELINEAIATPSTTQNINLEFPKSDFDYNLELQKFHNSDKFTTIRYKESYIVPQEGEFINSIIEKSGTPIEFIGDKEYHTLPIKYRNNSTKLIGGMELTIAKAYPESLIFPMFGFKWVKDLNGDNTYDFGEFQQKKRVFYNNENFYLAIPIIAGRYSEGNFIVELLNNYTGEIIKSDKRYIPKDRLDYYYFYFEPYQLKPGIYGINSKLENITTKKMVIDYSTFEIIRGTSETGEMSLLEKERLEREKKEEKERVEVENARRAQEEAHKKQLTSSTPHGIFFYNEWKDLNFDGKYDLNEFSGLNNAAYDLKKEVLRVGINYPDKKGEIIIQSWTIQGKLLGTTTNDFQRINGHYAGVGGDPYKSKDFIDMIQISGPGEYKITVSFVEGGTYEQKLIIKE